jgi:hypothetical protein
MACVDKEVSLSIMDTDAAAAPPLALTSGVSPAGPKVL